MSRFKCTYLALIVSLILTHHPAQAQRILFAENFNGYPQINFNYPWITGGTANAFPWRCDIPYLIFGVGFLDFDNDTKVAGTIGNSRNGDALLGTPRFNMGGVPHPWLSYDSYFLKFKNGGKTESATVEISLDNDSTWTVLKAAPVSTNRSMVRTYIDLSAFAGNNLVRLGFRYSDSLTPMAGWLVDNIKVFEPSEHDIALIHAYPEDTMLSYYQAPSSVSLSGTVMNAGTSAITSFTIIYSDGASPMKLYNVGGVNIAPFDTFHFVHSIPYDLTAVGKRSLKMWAALPGDTIRSNDTLGLSLRGAKFIPTKKLTIEEGTGTWNIQAPRGYVFMHALDTLGEPPTRISIHTNDIMGQKAYADYLYYMDQNFTPYFLFDRRGPVRPSTFFTTYEKQRNYFGFAEINFVATTVAGHMSLDAYIRPAIDLPGNYRLALVITEDGVHGTGSEYEQANGFAGGNAGPMGGFENLANPVPASAMKYDYVARSISPGPEGRAGCLPANMIAGQTYSCNLHGIYSPESPTTRLNASILLIRDSDSTILNSKSVAFRSLGLDNIAGGQWPMQVYPNPAGSSATVAFELPSRMLSALCATDITGRTVYQSPSGWMDAGTHKLELDVNGLSPGMYFITLEAGGQRATKKLSVVH